MTLEVIKPSPQTATKSRTWLGCEVFTHTEGNTTHIELSVPIALELAPDPKKDAGINWETGNFKTLPARKIIK